MNAGVRRPLRVTPRGWVALIFLSGILIGAFSAMTAHIAWDGTGYSEWPPAEQEERIEEDDPRWDCETMGNGQCGPQEVIGA